MKGSPRHVVAKHFQVRQLQECCAFDIWYALVVSYHSIISDIQRTHVL